MPELPEVETIVSGLRRMILDQEITEVDLLKATIMVGDPVQIHSLIGDAIISIERIGKYILVTTRMGSKIIVHLRMTGQLYVVTEPHLDKHVHLVLTFISGIRLIYRDLRIFGRWQFIPADEPFRNYINAGPDALEINKTDFNELTKAYGKTKLKTFLLDQTKVAGIGNIYADEICFAIGAHPERLLRLVDSTQLHSSIRRILKLGIKHKGSSVSDYVTADGVNGNFQNLLKAYHQKICVKCGKEMRRTRISGRGTCYCPRCQKR